jgi:hypothetical protein
VLPRFENPPLRIHRRQSRRIAIAPEPLVPPSVPAGRPCAVGTVPRRTGRSQLRLARTPEQRHAALLAAQLPQAARHGRRLLDEFVGRLLLGGLMDQVAQVLRELWNFLAVEPSESGGLGTTGELGLRCDGCSAV